jgi:sulfur carrier protein
VFVTVNGQRRELPAGATVASIVAALAAGPEGRGVAPPEGRGVAVAVEGEVVPRGSWSRTELTEGAHVEVVAAVQGG